MSNSLVSVIVPCYNQAQYLPEALQSVLDQTYTHWECIIVNDGSPDDTHKVTQEWLAKDARFKYIQKENGGLSSARNAGIDVAVGEFILPLDADDRIGSEYLELATEEFKKDDSLKVVYCRAEKFGDEVGEWNLPDFSLKKLASSNMIFCSAVYRKTDWERVGGYDIKMIYGLEDWEFWIAVLKDGGGVRKLDSICFYYRIKEVSMIKILSKDENKKNTKFEYLSVKHVDFFVNKLGSFYYLAKKNQELNRNNYKNITSKKNALKIFLKVFFGINYLN